MNKIFVIKILTYYLDPPSKLGFNEFIETRMSRFYHSSVIVTYTIPIVPTLNS